MSHLALGKSYLSYLLQLGSFSSENKKQIIEIVIKPITALGRLKKKYAVRTHIRMVNMKRFFLLRVGPVKHERQKKDIS